MYKDIYAWLIGEQKCEPSSIREARQYEREHKCNSYTAVEILNLCSADDLGRAVLEIHGVRACEKDLSDLKRNESIPVRLMIQHKFIAMIDPLTMTENKEDLITYILLSDPRSKIPVLDVVKASGFRGKTKIRWIRESLFAEWSNSNNRSYTASSIDNLAQSLDSVGTMNENNSALDVITDSTEDTAIVELVNEVIRKAMELKASDIHIEPFEKGCVIRYRIDGVLIMVNQIPEISKARRIVNRLKVMGGMDTNNFRSPQSGKIDFERNDIRVSTLPSICGEKVVLRILNGGAGIIRSLMELGVPKKSEEKLRRMFTRPYGIILVSGPTGSGKSSTLAAILKELCTDDVCMVTIEDPVEYRLPGAVQVNVSPQTGLTFASVLRETLRQDPNIIMVGEIRDKETAEIAMQAANTGHLVFSTIHTNSSVSAITRLHDMGVDGYMVADNIIGIMSQSLVRKLCPNCKKNHIIDENDIARYAAPKRLLGRECFVPGHGCHKCNNTGYAGRTIAFEILDMSPRIVDAIHEKKATADIEQIAQEQQFEKKLDYAYTLVENGTTSLKEVHRVLGGINIEETNS